MTVDTKDAGEGTLEVTLTRPNGRPLQNTVSAIGSGRYEAIFVPSESGQYRATVLFNKETVEGRKLIYNIYY